MAALWGVGEETLTACNMDFFPMETLDETSALTSEESLEALQSCLDPSILSIFEDAPTTETKVLDDENEATLLTALTEILDNVDDENLSPFDTLPDSDLLSGQKGRENSPLRRLLCLSRSPPEKDTPSTARPSFTGKNLPRKHADSLQRSDGEEEEDGSLTLSPVGHDFSPQNNMLDWEGLTLPLPVTYEQEDENCVSVSLGDLVRHIHPYCMAICVENEEGEQILPEGGILLEVVDQGENGEPILAIPDMDLPVALPQNEQKHQDDWNDVGSDSSEHIVVDDDDEDLTFSAAPLKVSAPTRSSDKDEMIIQREKDDLKEKSPSQRRKKKKSKELCPPKAVEGRVLRSSTAKKGIQESHKKTRRKSLKDETRKNVSAVSSVSAPSSSGTIAIKADPRQNKTRVEITTTAQLPKTNGNVTSSVSPKQETASLKAVFNDSQQSYSPTVVSSQQPVEIAKHPGPENVVESTAAPSAVLPQVSSQSPTAAAIPMTQPVREALPLMASVVPEPKPKSLSLAEYRRLRLQKKPTPVENQDASNSSKWPSLPELPKELPPIPCLPDPSTKDPRRPITQPSKKEGEEAKPAWQPRGRCAPPTPEALLVPPSYMVSSSSRVSASSNVQKHQQTHKPSRPSVPQAHQISVSNSEKNLTVEHTSAVLNVSQGNDSSASTHPETPLLTSASGKCSPTLSDVNAGQSKSVEPPVTSSSITTEATKPSAAPMPSSSACQKNTVYTVMPEVKAPTVVGHPISSGGKFPKASDTRVASATYPSNTEHLKIEPDMMVTKGKPTTEGKPETAKSPTQELIEAFTSEIGIEAADLTSLLEQFEETQAKEEKCVPEVSGRAAAVGNSSTGLTPEITVVKRVKANDFTCTAALTPPATPPHQMWKPLAPVALMGKSKTAEASKSSPSKIIQIDPRPLPSSCRYRSRPTLTAATAAPEVVCMDHDYCLPNKGTEDVGKRWNVKQQPSITIKPIKPNTTTTQMRPTAPTMSARPTTVASFTTKAQEVQLTEVLDDRTDGMLNSSVLETPDASPAHEENVEEQSPKPGPFERSYRRRATSRSPSPRSSPKGEDRGRSRKRIHRSPSPVSSSSDSHSSRSRSRSQSPLKKRYKPSRSRSRSSSSSCSYRSSSSVSCSPPRRRRYSYSSSRSGSWSRSRSRSPSPERRSQWNMSRGFHRPSGRQSFGHSPRINTEKKSKEKAIEERRVVYVGRIRGTMTQKELKERFSLFGEVEDCTLHFRDHGDHYGFVTFYDTKDAFTAIENGSKLRKPDELPFDLCFGGRRQFCQTSYADLDSSREYEPTPARSKLNALDFDTLLRQAKQQLKR